MHGDTRLQPDRSRAQTGRARRVRGGFTLMEVLVSLGIFALGMIAVASVFPVAILLQRETVYEVESKQFGRNAESLVEGVGFVASAAQWETVDNDGNPNDGVKPLPIQAIDAIPVDDRSYNVSTTVYSRRVFWVPLVYDEDPDAAVEEWRVFLFVVRSRENYFFDHPTFATSAPDFTYIADGNATLNDPTYVPPVLRADIDTGLSANSNTLYTSTTSEVNHLRIGDKIVDQTGVVRTVTAIDRAANNVTVDTRFPDSSASDFPQYYYYAHPGYNGSGGALLTTSSFVDVITILQTTDLEVIHTP